MANIAPIAQLDNAPPSEGGDCRFDSCWVRHQFPPNETRNGKLSARRSLGEGRAAYMYLRPAYAEKQTHKTKPADRRVLILTFFYQIQYFVFDQKGQDFITYIYTDNTTQKHYLRIMIACCIINRWRSSK